MNRIGDNLLCTGSNEKIVQEFSKEGVEFILIGGLAVSWYCTSRQANDMDLLVNPTKENSVIVTQALMRLGLNDFASNAFAKLNVQVALKTFYYADILTPASNSLTFDDLMNGSTIGKLFNIPVHIPSIRKLITMKERVVSSTEKELSKQKQDIALLRSLPV